MLVGVRLYGVPLEFWTAKGLSYIAGAIGKPLHADRMTSEKRRISYARICIEVDASKDLTKEFYLQCENGEWTTVLVEYDWRPSVCSLCRVFGHTTASCGKNPPKHSQPSDLPTAPSSKLGAEEGWVEIGEKGKGKKSVPVCNEARIETGHEAVTTPSTNHQSDSSMGAVNAPPSSSSKADANLPPKVMPDGSPPLVSRDNCLN